MQGDILNESIQLLIYGMGTVFIFLFILILATTAMSRLITRYAPEIAPVAPAKRQAGAVQKVDPDVLQAIGQAVQAYRRERR